jgi:hypothetical protein
MRLAIGSGVLAARALIDGGDYAAAAEREFALVRRAGVVNRFLWEAGRAAGYRPIMAALRWRGPERALRWMHRPSRTQALLWPVASWWARKAYGARLEPRSAPLAGA